MEKSINSPDDLSMERFKIKTDDVRKLTMEEFAEIVRQDTAADDKMSENS